MNNKKARSSGSKGIGFKIVLLLLSSVLFWLSNPNIFFEDGFGWLAFINYLPLLFLIKKSRFIETVIFGALYGVLSYGLYGYWLNSFHPLGLIIVCIGYLLICAVFFSVLKWADLITSKNGWLLQFVIICGYEYLKTLGFFGMNYGVTAYTQWKNTYLIQICSLGGVFALNYIVIFPSAFLFSLISKKKERSRLLNHVDNARKSSISAYVKKEKALSDTSLKLTFICGSLWLIIFAASYIYGISVMGKFNSKDYVTVAAIQNNESPWKNGIEEYEIGIKMYMEKFYKFNK